MNLYLNLLYATVVKFRAAPAEVTGGAVIMRDGAQSQCNCSNHLLTSVGLRRYFNVIVTASTHIKPRPLPVCCGKCTAVCNALSFSFFQARSKYEILVTFRDFLIMPRAAADEFGARLPRSQIPSRWSR